jgi:hypothetical protein
VDKPHVSATEYRVLAIMCQQEWTDWDVLAEALKGNGWWRRLMRERCAAGYMERRAETLTANRQPGWIMDLCIERGYEPWSKEAFSFFEAHRLTPTGRSLCEALGLLSPAEAAQRQWEAMQAVGASDGH